MSASKRQLARYDEEAIETALTVIALVGGNTRHARDRLKEQGLDIPLSTLRSWVERTHAARYQEIRDERAAEIQRRVAVRQEDLALKAADVTERMLQRLEGEINEIPIRDLAGAARNVGTISGIGSDKLMTLRERPLPAPAPTRNVEEIVKALQGMGVVRRDEPVIDATAIVIEETTATQPQGGAC